MDINNNSVSKLLEIKCETTNIGEFIKQISERMKLMESTLVIDRFEGEFAVCENKENKQMVNLKRSEIPVEAKEGNVLKYQEGKYIIDSIETKQIQERIQNKMKKLWNN